jgi:EAL domain-containing protein (putative c-di-GMP-specific phosphodiesterase class I)
VPVSGRELPVRASIGTTTLDPKQGGADIEQLLKQADLAMYSAKNGGKGTAVRYTPGVVNVAVGKDDLEKRITLSEDVRGGRIGTVFQPIVDTKSGDLFAMEALARWAYRGRPVPPTEFIPLADRGGFLADLDLLVAERALAVASAPECRPHGMIVSINVGLKRMLEHEMPRRLRHMIEQFRISPARLVVEVSEQEILEDDKVVAALEELRDIGVSFAIDDFGVGYSNLSRLELLRPDIVKLDQSFLTPLQTSRGSHLVLRRVIELVHDLGAIVVAEGVETQRQRDVLGDLGCDTVQGFLLGLPAARAIVRTAEEVA